MRAAVMMRLGDAVSTHSRPKAAGCEFLGYLDGIHVSTHSRPKAAGVFFALHARADARVSTHSRPKAAGFSVVFNEEEPSGFNTQPPEGGWNPYRREGVSMAEVSTHSRPKAAGSTSP